MLFESDAGSTAVQSVPGGARIVEVIDEPGESTITYSYDVAVAADVRLVEAEDDTIVAVKEGVSGATAWLQVVGEIRSPWAIDANGVPQPVSYTLVDDVLTMEISPTASAEYPIVADPEARVGDYRFTWNVLTPHIVTAYANKRGSTAINVGSGAICAAIALVPAVGPAISVMCVANEAILGIGQLYGRCQWVKFNLVSNPRVTKGLYSGAFCR